MIKFLIVEEDLRVSGTSQGIISRSFIGYLSKSFPQAIIDLIYIHAHDSSIDKLSILPCNLIIDHTYKIEPPFHIKWLNRILRRLTNIMIYENFITHQFGRIINSVDYAAYDYIFVRSTGFNCYSILSLNGLPIIKRSIIFFNEPYPLAWSPGKNRKFEKNDFLRLKKMRNILSQVRGCVATKFLAQDLQFLYGSSIRFFDLPHVFDSEMFTIIRKNKNTHQSVFVFGYHGSTQYGRDIKKVLNAYKELLNERSELFGKTKFILRLKSDYLQDLKNEFVDTNEIEFLPLINANLCLEEQINLIDCNVLLENGPLYSSSLLGKAPVVNSSGGNVIIVSPKRSELREIANPESVTGYDKNDIKQKLLKTIERNNSEDKIFPFGNYFSQEIFKCKMEELMNSLRAV